jgi:hypothetical protein
MPNTATRKPEQLDQAAFCGYMTDGRRPNVYFLERVRG